MYLIERKYLIKASDWVLYLGLCVISFIFMKEVLSQFFEATTNYKQTEEPIVENPTITVCFSRYDHKDLKLGSKFKIRMGDEETIDLDHKTSMKLKLGKNYYREDKDKLVTVEYLRSENAFNCYKITPNFLILGNWIYHIFEFDDKTPLEKLPSLQIYITSENNSYGIVREFWDDGSQLSFRLKLGDVAKKKILLHPEKVLNLESKSKCRTEPYYECYGKHLLEKVIKNCSKECLPLTLPSITNSSTCITNKCAKTVEEHTWWTIPTDVCPKPCTLLQFTERSHLDFESTASKSNDRKLFLYYMLARSDKTSVYEEYLIYDTNGMIGAVGGTLGLFIGFSFSNIATAFVGCFQKFIQ